jgi:hypothetical protein
MSHYTHCVAYSVHTTGFNSVPVYSDDHGKNWKAGTYMKTRDAKNLGLGEPSIALLGSGPGEMVMAARAAGAPHMSFARSHDEGMTWDMAQSVPEINSPGCQGAVLGIPGGAGALISSPVGASR